MKTYVATPASPPQPVDHSHTDQPTHVLWNGRRGQRREEVVPHSLLVAHGAHARTKAIIRKPFHGIHECFLGLSQEHKVSLGCAANTKLIRMVLRRHPTELGLDGSLIGKG